MCVALQQANKGPARTSSINTSGMRLATADLVDTGHAIEKLNMMPRSEEKIRIDAPNHGKARATY